MIPDKSKSWFYSINESQVGPLTFEQLEKSANSGIFNRQTTKVWCEGLENWVLASSIEGLFSSPPPLSSPPLSPSPRMLLDESYARKIERNGQFIQTELIFSLIIVSWIIQKICSIYQIEYANSIVSRARSGIDVSQSEVAVFQGGLAMISFIATLTFLIYLGKFIYRKWKFVEKYSNISAGKAAWFFFIPFFNFYWVFKIFAGYHEPFNKMIRECNLSKSYELENYWGLLYAVMFIPNALVIGIPTNSTLMFLFHLIDIANIVITALYVLTISRRINLVYAQIRANRA
jgi:hypothetical protein